MTYVSVADCRDWLGFDDSADDPELDAVLLAVDEAIDEFCGQRFAKDSDTPSARLFVADSFATVRLFPSVIGSTSGMVVKTDDNGDGTFETTWTTSDYSTLPFSDIGPDGKSGWPIRALQADRLRGKSWPCWHDRPGVQVTAVWGWASVPASVLLAARMLVAAWHQRRATVAGQGGFQGFFESAVRDDPTVQDLLGKYRARPKAAIA